MQSYDMTIHDISAADDTALADPTKCIALPALESPAGIFKMPLEIITNITTDLPNRDLKNLRLTCLALSERVSLRFERVFISAHRRDIEAFRGVANHETWRLQVLEIIYDDAVLAPTGSIDMEEGHLRRCELHWDPDAEEPPAGVVPAWFSVASMLNQKGSHEYPEMRIEESWSYYRALLRNQRQVIRSGILPGILEYGLERFSNLTTVTVTPMAHGKAAKSPPVYPTPTIRAFPPGFNYPKPTGWLYANYEGNGTLPDWKPSLKGWIGLRLVLDVLAKSRHAENITSLFLSSGSMVSGVHGGVFEEPCVEMANLATILARANFNTLHMDILCEERRGCHWKGFHNGLLGSALANAAGGKGLEYLSLAMHGADWSIFHRNRHEPLPRELFPPASLARLRCLRLSGFCLDLNRLLVVLRALPTTLQRVDLSLLHFPLGSYKELLERMRNELDWRHRAMRPEVHMPLPSGREEGHYAEAEFHARLMAFLYEDVAQNRVPEIYQTDVMHAIDAMMVNTAS